MQLLCTPMSCALSWCRGLYVSLDARAASSYLARADLIKDLIKDLARADLSS